jgi:hypothetical protein
MKQVLPGSGDRRAQIGPTFEMSLVTPKAQLGPNFEMPVETQTQLGHTLEMPPMTQKHSLQLPYTCYWCHKGTAWTYLGNATGNTKAQLGPTFLRNATGATGATGATFL